MTEIQYLSHNIYPKYKINKLVFGQVNTLLSVLYVFYIRGTIVLFLSNTRVKTCVGVYILIIISVRCAAYRPDIWCNPVYIAY